MKYFAYASNMSADRMRFKGILFEDRESARAYGWKLMFNEIGERDGQGYANMEFSIQEDFVEGILYDIHPGDLIRLDAWEKCPEDYERKTIKVVTNKGIIVEAEAYVALPSKTAIGLKPTQEYLGWVLEGKEFLSDEYFEKLSLTETI